MAQQTWFQFLNLVGRPITFEAERICRAMDLVAKKEREIDDLKRQITVMERDLQSEVEKEWNSEEIEAAKQLFKQYNP